VGRYWWGGLGVGISHIICRMNVSAAEKTARIVHALFSPGGPLFGLVPQSYYLLYFAPSLGDTVTLQYFWLANSR
jgi:hypothetical protein